MYYYNQTTFAAIIHKNIFRMQCLQKPEPDSRQFPSNSSSELLIFILIKGVEGIIQRFDLVCQLRGALTEFGNLLSRCAVDEVCV